MATAAWIAVLQGMLPMAGAASPFEDTIRPILEKNCFSCHGPEKQKSGYRLDVKSIALTGGEGHAPNIIPGNSAASPLMKFISGADKDLAMPPKGLPLSPGGGFRAALQGASLGCTAFTAAWPQGPR